MPGIHAAGRAGDTIDKVIQHFTDPYAKSKRALKSKNIASQPAFAGLRKVKKAQAGMPYLPPASAAGSQPASKSVLSRTARAVEPEPQIRKKPSALKTLKQELLHSLSQLKKKATGKNWKPVPESTIQSLPNQKLKHDASSFNKVLSDLDRLKSERDKIEEGLHDFHKVFKGSLKAAYRDTPPANGRFMGGDGKPYNFEKTETAEERAELQEKLRRSFTESEDFKSLTEDSRTLVEIDQKRSALKKEAAHLNKQLLKQIP